MSELDLDAIRARADAATAGPWTWREHPSGFFEFSNAGGVIGWGQEEAAFEFAAHARTDIPALLAEVDSLRVENEALRHAYREIAALWAHDEPENAHQQPKTELAGDEQL
jgi:hypothetical protein